MFNDYAASLEARLIDEGYARLRHNIWALARPPILYVVTLCNAANTLPADHARRVTDLLSRIQPDRVAANHVLALNLIYVEGATNDLRAFVDTQPVLTDAPVIQVWWLADGRTKTLSPGKGQPTELYNLKGLCTQAFAPAPPPKQRRVQTPAWTRPKDHRLTVFLVCVNAAFFLVTALSGQLENFLLVFGNHPVYVFEGHQYWRLLTSMFFHLSLWHLACNSLALYIFGSVMEDVFSRARLLALYLVSGVVGSVFSALFTQALSVGASGAIFGILGGLLGYTLKTRKRLSGFDSLTLLVFALGFFLSGVFLGGVDHFAHLGGLLCGFVLGFFLPPPEPRS